jgi:hypothetical protein
VAEEDARTKHAHRRKEEQQKTWDGEIPSRKLLCIKWGYQEGDP